MNAELNQGQLGTIVSWKVPSEVPYPKLLDAMNAAGIDEKMCKEMRPKDALARALGEMRKGRVIRKLRREDDKLYFQLTKEHLSETEATYTKETEVVLHLSTGAIQCQDLEIRDKVVLLLSEHLGKRLTSDLSRLLMRIYAEKEADLIPIREAGGAYFVPDSHRGLVEQTRTLLDGIGGRLRSFDVRLGSEDTAESVADSMSEYLSQVISDFRETCKAVDSKTRSDVQARRRETVAVLRRKLDNYQGLLSGYAAHIKEQVDEAETDLLRRLATGPAED